MPSIPQLRPFLAVAVLAAALAAQRPEPVDQEAVDFLREQGLQHSQVMDHLSWMCDVYGPRLTGSPNLRKAQQWAMQTLRGFGLQNVRTEAWGPFGRGWRCEHSAVEVVGDNPWPVLAYPKAWSPSIDGRVEADVVDALALGAEALQQLDLARCVVLLEEPREVAEPFDGVSRRLDDADLVRLADGVRQPRGGGRRPDRGELPIGFQKRQAVMKVLEQKPPLAIFDRGGKGDYGTVFVSGASAMANADGSRGSARAADARVVPQFTLAVEHYNRMVRVLQKGVPVKVAIELRSSFFDADANDYNVTAELPGIDPQLQSQLVMLGGHFDSWHCGTGATDNGCGSAVAIEAIRLLAALCQQRGQGPRRTIRVALWSGEEQGLLGSRAYARQHFLGDDGKPLPEHALLSGYFNLDNGTGRVRGVYLQGNAAVQPIFRAWLQPFHDLDAHTLTLDDTGGTDHLAFDAVGLPGFQFIQDPVSYNTRTHHSNMDVWDHAVADDLRQASTIMAAFVWHTAQRDELLPRKPMPDPAQQGQRRGRRRGGAGG